MHFGVCGDPTIAAVAARAGYDFAEWTVGALLKPRESEDAFRVALDMARGAELPYPVVNCFLPADLKITGPEVDIPALQKYVACVMRRAEQAGVEIIVLGSGGARRIPDGFDVQTAHGQLVSFWSMTAPIALDHGVTVVVEPLNQSECNVLTSVAECAALVREVAHPAVQLLVDAYHLMHDNDSYEDIVTHGDLLRHAHIATVPNRLVPGAETCDFAPFFHALAKARYKGRISIEGKIPSPATDLATGRALMAGLANESALSKRAKPFDITVTACERMKGVALVALSGYLDTQTVSEFDAALSIRKCIEYRSFVMDMRDLHHLSSAGIASFMWLVQEARRRGGDVVLFSPIEQVYSVLELLGFTDIFRFTSSFEEALSLLGEQPRSAD